MWAVDTVLTVTTVVFVLLRSSMFASDEILIWFSRDHSRARAGNFVPARSDRFALPLC